MTQEQWDRVLLELQKGKSVSRNTPGVWLCETASSFQNVMNWFEQEQTKLYFKTILF